MKGLVYHLPTDEDISNILKEFTVDFLLKGYGHLMQDLYAKLLSDSDLVNDLFGTIWKMIWNSLAPDVELGFEHVLVSISFQQTHIDTSHFFWLVTYFLKFAAQLELDLEHIKCVLSYKIVSYLTYEAVMLYEQLELSSRQYEIELEPSLRRMHLVSWKIRIEFVPFVRIWMRLSCFPTHFRLQVVTAIREFLQALNTYKNIGHLSSNDIEYIRLLQLEISVTEDLKQLFILLIRNYKPTIQSKQYLQDLIVTNHILLLIPDSVSGEESNQDAKIKLKEHIQQ